MTLWSLRIVLHRTWPQPGLAISTRRTVGPLPAPAPRREDEVILAASDVYRPSR